MARTVPALSTIGRAYAAGRLATLRPPRPLQLHRVEQALRSASPEVQAAYAAGAAADPAGPMPVAAEVLTEVVARLARPTVEDLPGGEV